MCCWQVEQALRRQSGTPQLPEVWELLYKVARDMSRAAGAEELVNSLQTAAESYLVVSLPSSMSCSQGSGFPIERSASSGPRCRSQNFRV